MNHRRKLAGISFREGSREWRGLGLAIVACFALTIGVVTILRSLKPSAVAQEVKPADRQRPVFVRPNIVAPGGSYEIHIDREAGRFSDTTSVTTSSTDVIVMSRTLREAGGLTLQLGVGASQRDGQVTLTFTTPTNGGPDEVIDVDVLIVRVLGSKNPRL